MFPNKSQKAVVMYWQGADEPKVVFMMMQKQAPILWQRGGQPSDRGQEELRQPVQRPYPASPTNDGILWRRKADTANMALPSERARAQGRSPVSGISLYSYCSCLTFLEPPILPLVCLFALQVVAKETVDGNTISTIAGYAMLRRLFAAAIVALFSCLSIFMWAPLFIVRASENIRMQLLIVGLKIDKA